MTNPSTENVNGDVKEIYIQVEANIPNATDEERMNVCPDGFDHCQRVMVAFLVRCMDIVNKYYVVDYDAVTITDQNNQTWGGNIFSCCLGSFPAGAMPEVDERNTESLLIKIISELNQCNHETEFYYEQMGRNLQER